MKYIDRLRSELPDALTAKEAAKVLHISDRSFETLVQQQQFYVIGIGGGEHRCGKRLFPKETLIDYILRNTKAPHARFSTADRSSDARRLKFEPGQSS